MRLATIATYGGWINELAFGVTLTVGILFLISVAIFAILHSEGDNALGVGIVMGVLGFLLLVLLCFSISLR